MAITIISASYTQTTTSVNVTIPFDRTTLIVSTSDNNAPTFDGVSLTAGTSYNSNSTFYWWYYTNPPVGTYSLAANTNTILNNFVLDNVDLVTPLSTQISIPTATFNANGTNYTTSGDLSTPYPTFFGVASLIYPGPVNISATSITAGSILNTTTSPVRVCTLEIPALPTYSSSALYYVTTGSGPFACPSPSFIFLNNTDINRFSSQVMIF